LQQTLVVHSDLISYGRILDLQRGWAKALAQGSVEPLIWIGAHPPVITLGKQGDEKELNHTPETLSRMGVELHSIERGGLATIHGPGQLVAYPIWPFKTIGLGVKDYVWRLEEAMIRTLAELGIQAGRNELNPGAWAGPDKIGFVGLAIKNGVIFHGLSLNVNLDLNLFKLIIPCGLDKVAITSAHQLLGRPVDTAEAGRIMAQKLCRLLDAEAREIGLEEAEAKLAELSPTEERQATG
jgi:lipoate-protein ligase B